MKRIAALLCVLIVLILSFSSAAFASGLSVESVSPADGSKGYQPQNMAIKVKFSEQMNDSAENASKFSVTDPEGNAIPFQLVHSEKKYPNELWLVLSQDLAPDTEYTVTVQSGITSASGSTFDGEQTTTFRTRNVKIDSYISMGFMVVFMVFMFTATSKAAKKAAEKADPIAAERAAIAKMNPYKMAKEKNISVEEAQAIISKEKEKLAKKMAKAEEEARKREEAKRAEMAAIEAELDAQEAAARHAANYQVKGPRSIKAAGGTVPRSVIKKNKAKREAAEKAARAKANQGKKKK